MREGLILIVAFVWPFVCVLAYYQLYRVMNIEARQYWVVLLLSMLLPIPCVLRMLPLVSWHDGKKLSGFISLILYLLAVIAAVFLFLIIARDYYT